MAVTKTALILLCCACSTLAWENLPQIPANRRAEYYLQHDDGAYKYAYDTGEGQSALVNADATNQVVGQWQYVDNNGQRVNWQYTAGEGGYVPVMSAVAGGSAAKTAQNKVTGYQASFGGSGSGTGSHVASYMGHGTSSGSGSGQGVSQGDFSAKATDADYDENADASYAFNIDTDDYKRTESADPKGNIKGEYSYSSPVGGSHAISYLAGSDTGFVVTKTTSDESGIAAATKSGSYKQQQSIYAPAPVKPYSGPLSDAVAVHNPDGSFSYAYSTGDHSHTATGDAKNNVRGSYTFTAKDDGLKRTVNYHAGSATGYVATGDHLPVAPVAGGSTAGQKSAWAGETKSNQQSWSAKQVSAIGVQPKTVEPSNAQTVINPDGSYMFSYSTSDHSRQESADAKNNVQGTYSWKGDGTSRKIDYHAGADTGFVATGDGLIPVAEVQSHTLGKNVWSSGSQSSVGQQSVSVNSAAHQEENYGPSDASYAFSYEAADHARNEASDAQGNVKGTFSFVADDGVQRKIDYSAGAEQGFIANGAHIPVAPEASAPVATKSTGGSAWAAAPNVATHQEQMAYGSDEDNGDGSYAYSYKTDTSSKEETSDTQGNVAGSFQYVDANGENRKLSYTSRGEEGFIASGDHLPVAGAVPVVPSSSSGGSVWAAKAVGSGSGSAWSAGNQQQVSSHLAARADDSVSNQKTDGSYSYSYSTGDQSVQQASDANNNVQGSYSFKAKDDGQTRTVNWKAGRETGFVASGAHLPVAPVAGAVAAPSGASAWSAKSSTTSGSAWAPAPVQTAPAAWVATKSSDSTGSHNNDGSYSYSYSTGDQSVQHSADAANNVRGSYSFKAADDGQTRKVDYTASAATGFVATGAHLPVAPVDTGAAAWSAKSASSGSAWASHSTGALVSPPVWSPKTAPTPAVWSAHSGTGIATSAGSQSSDQKNDGSYSYSYSTDTQNVQQSSDSDNNVKGSYSFKAKDDGKLRTVNWQAGSATGFVAQGAHLPVAPVDGSSLETRLASLPAQSYGGSSSHVSHATASSHSASSGPIDELDNGDASYAYSYKTDTSAKEETSDAKGNVVGSFTYLGGDGVSRKLSYTARKEDGFSAQGDHLPVAPSVDGVASAQQATLQSRPYAPLPVMRSYGEASNVGHVAAVHAHAHAHAHGQESRDGNVVITKYLPPDSHHKYGYIFDTKA